VSILPDRDDFDQPPDEDPESVGARLEANLQGIQGATLAWAKISGDHPDRQQAIARNHRLRDYTDVVRMMLDPTLTERVARERQRLWDAAHRSGLFAEQITASELNYQLKFRRIKPPYPSVTKALKRAAFRNLAEFKVWYGEHPDGPDE